MKPLFAAILLLAFFGVEACSSVRSHRGTLPPPPPPPPAYAPDASQPPPPPPPAAPTTAAQPRPAPAKPEPPPPAARTLAFADGMEKVSDADVEASLERWADGNDINLEHVIKRVGVFVEVAAIIKWDENPKRTRDPADHDRLARESEETAKLLVAAAKDGKTDQIKPLSDKLLQQCVDCHTKYK